MLSGRIVMRSSRICSGESPTWSTFTPMERTTGLKRRSPVSPEEAIALSRPAAERWKVSSGEAGEKIRPGIPSRSRRA